MAFPFDALSWLIRGRYKLTPQVLADGETGELPVDVNGRPLVRVVGGSLITGTHRRSASKGDLVKTGPGALIGARGFNAGASACYVLLIDRSTAPVNGAATVYERFLVPAGGSFGFQAEEPIPFATGLAWAASSTPTNVTLIAGDDVAIVVTYQ